jgi:hypothetical protein
MKIVASRFVIVTHFMSVTLMNGMPRSPEVARWPDPAALSAVGPWLAHLPGLFLEKES